MKDQTPPSPVDDSRKPGQALHGYRNDVNWEGGSGRHPYTNQGPRETPSHAGWAYPQGNRGSRSGNAVQQLEQAKQKP